jgi:preprotein translocase subunit SecE
MMLWSGVNFYRAYRRSVTSAGRRRMVYLMAGATAPALGSFPFLLFGANVVANHHFLFWLTVVLSNGLSSVLIILMAYAVAFFGVDQRIEWLKAGFFGEYMDHNAIVILIFITITRQLSKQLGYSTAAIEVVIMLVIIIYAIFDNLSCTYVEKNYFYVVMNKY